uniref:Apoptosis facilitator Bcl-2-like protein 14 n=1 Tax=Sinocyclocheilus anshuiensis TaxID=1608454 RepID=A0A671LYS4_9TELE
MNIDFLKHTARRGGSPAPDRSKVPVCTDWRHDQVREILYLRSVTLSEMIITFILILMSCLLKTGDEQFGDVAEKLTQIVDNGLLDEELLQTVDKRLIVDEGLESAGGVKDVDQDVIDKLVDLLKKSGDNLNERIQSNHELLGYLQRTFSYDLFKKVTEAFITSVVPEYLQSRRKREQIALAFEVTSRLKALDLHPMNRAMGYGAQYLQEYFAPWVKQHGGWVRVYAPVFS